MRVGEYYKGNMLVIVAMILAFPAAPIVLGLWCTVLYLFPRCSCSSPPIIVLILPVLWMNFATSFMPFSLLIKNFHSLAILPVASLNSALALPYFLQSMM
ncbi:hypothetical protein BKA70DRAFT_86737 [Coprinopsis sp. MPI-PUGE-AT-0042]|nr:hypothetical protein BKA70DRAFT_86737 [Coprinopsis sp. MPI-PUGE-AT-0042]